MTREHFCRCHLRISRERDDRELLGLGSSTERSDHNLLIAAPTVFSAHAWCVFNYERARGAVKIEPKRRHASVITKIMLCRLCVYAAVGFAAGHTHMCLNWRLE
jgi:hypothetical protein